MYRVKVFNKGVAVAMFLGNLIDSAVTRKIRDPEVPW